TWAMYACTAAESLPFTRNLQAGRRAVLGADKSSSSKAVTVFECLKSADYTWCSQAHPEGVVWTVYLPELYRIDSGMVDQESVRFALAPSQEWLSDSDES